MSCFFKRAKKRGEIEKRLRSGRNQGRDGGGIGCKRKGGRLYTTAKATMLASCQQGGVYLGFVTWGTHSAKHDHQRSREAKSRCQ